jgi:hypothetical protein
MALPADVVSFRRWMVVGVPGKAILPPDAEEEAGARAPRSLTTPDVLDALRQDAKQAGFHRTGVGS